MKKVLIGMSGGVDSSVAAALLLDKGYEVHGITLNLLSQDGKEAAADAKKSADKLGIEHEVVDLKKHFQKHVMDYFVNEYTNGRTPNPCVVCNKKIKFGALLDYALEKDYDYIATGHYANVIYDDLRKRWLLKKSKSAKDQSYFLYALTQHQLSHCLFPLGDLEKAEVRVLAQNYGLSVALKSESQDICFIKNESHDEFIKKYSNSTPKPGDFVDEKGNKIGTHKGIINYTVGQRKGLGISFSEPLYVTEILSDSNKIVLGTSDSGKCRQAIIENVNFISFDVFDEAVHAFVKIRYRAPLVPCTVFPHEDNTACIMFDEPQKFLAPGQSAVFYDNTGLVIGGGIIK